MQSRFRGAMLATLAGDAILAPYEWTWTPERIKADIEMRGGLIAHEYAPFDYTEPFKGKRTMMMGQPTDDSELAAALAESLVECKGLDEADLFRRLRRFIIDRKSLLTEVAYGKGGTLTASLTPPTYEESSALFAAGKTQTPPSNGSLMRCIPIPLMFLRDEEKLVDAARRQSMVTHRNSSAVAACIAYSTMVSYVLEGLSPARAWGVTDAILSRSAFSDMPAMREVLAIDVTEPPRFAEIEPIKGSVVLSLRIAVWASIHAESLADGIIKVGLLGGDTDTYGAIAGGILGAHFGEEAIPPQWEAALKGTDVMLSLAERLYEQAHAPNR
jgi:ADP-ribosyl-[dinitrogen reductase] hydrolase